MQVVHAALLFADARQELAEPPLLLLEHAKAVADNAASAPRIQPFIFISFSLSIAGPRQVGWTGYHGNPF